MAGTSVVSPLAPSPTAARANPTDHVLLIKDLAVNVLEGYLDGASAVACVRVCKTWSNYFKNQATHAKEDEYCRRVGYRSKLVIALRSRQLSLWRLPEVDLRGRTGRTEYIDFLKPEDVAFPLMRFTDTSGRVGLALNVRGNADGNVELPTGTVPIRQVSETLALFRRYPDCNTWSIGSRGGFSHRVYSAVHSPDHTAAMHLGCPTCPPFLKQNGFISWAVALITKTDLAMKIDGEIHQVADPAPLPPMPPKPSALLPPTPPRPVVPTPSYFATTGKLLLLGTLLFVAFLVYRRRFPDVFRF